MTGSMTLAIRNASSGDEEAMQLTFDRAITQLRGIAESAAFDSKHAEDLVSEAWIKFKEVGGLIDWERREQFFAFLYEACRRVSINIIRRENAIIHGGGVRHVDIAQTEVASPGSDSMETVLPRNLEDERRSQRNRAIIAVMQLWKIDGLRQAIDKLSPARAEVMRLKCIDGLSRQEIEERTGRAKATVNELLREGLEKLNLTKQATHVSQFLAALASLQDTHPEYSLPYALRVCDNETKESIATLMRISEAEVAERLALADAYIDTRCSG